MCQQVDFDRWQRPPGFSRFKALNPPSPDRSSGSVLGPCSLYEATQMAGHISPVATRSSPCDLS